MGFASVFLAGFGWEEVLPTSLYSAFHSPLHHLHLLTAGIWIPDVNQAPCRQVAWTHLPIKRYLVNAGVLQMCILSNGQQVVSLTPSTNFSFLLVGTLSPNLQHPGSFSIPAAAWVQTQPRRWWWQWETLRSKWERARKRRREAAWSSSLRKENGRVRWTADGWDGLFRSADRRGGNAMERKRRGLVIAELLWSLSPSSCPRSRSSAATPTCLSRTRRPCCWPMQTQGRCLPSLVCNIQMCWLTPIIREHSEPKCKVAIWERFVGNLSF